MGSSNRRLVLPIAVFMLLLTVLPGGLAAAQPDGGVPPVGEMPDQKMGGEALMGFGLLGEDYFLSLAIGTSFQFGKYAFGIQAPLRIRVIDQDPQDAHWYRSEDWDEASDWTRILRFFQYGMPQDPFYLRLGELTGSSVGHGTIISRYYNTLELDHYHTGLSTKVNLEKGGAEFLTNDILKWNMVGLRGYVAPLALFLPDAGSFAKKFRVGSTFAADFMAPEEIRLTVDGQQQIDSDNNLRFDRATAWFWGLDFEYQLVATEIVSVTPYTDFNVFKDLGVGWHLGVLNGFRIWKSEFELRLEYRLLSARYAPAYFNSLYDLERFQFLALSTGEVVPKLRYYEDANLSYRNGFYGELYANILGLVGIGGSYEDYQGPDNASVVLRMDLPAIAGVKVAGYYSRRNFDGFDEFFSLDDAYAVVEARVKVAGPLFLYGIYSIYWRLVDDDDSARYGEYETTDSFQFGAGAAFSF